MVTPWSLTQEVAGSNKPKLMNEYVLSLNLLNSVNIEGVHGQRVMPPQAGNYRSKTKDRFLPNLKF